MKKPLELFDYNESHTKSDLKTIIIKEYRPIREEDIKWDWREIITINHQGREIKRHDYVPVVNGEDVFLFRRHGKSMIQLVCLGRNFTLYNQFYKLFGLDKTVKLVNNNHYVLRNNDSEDSKEEAKG